MLWNGIGKDKHRSLLIRDNFTLTFYENKEAIDYLKEKARGNPSQEKKEGEPECKCKLQHKLKKKEFLAEQKYSIALAMDIDHLGQYIKKMQAQHGASKGSNIGLSMAGEKIVEIGNCMFDFCNKVNSDNSSSNWVGYHTHGDEFIILTGSKREGDYEELCKLVPYNAKLGLKLIDAVKKKTDLGISVGVGVTSKWADKAVSIAKQNNHRGIVAICGRSERVKYGYLSWIAKNDSEIDKIVDCCWGKGRIALDLNASTAPAPFFFIED